MKKICQSPLDKRKNCAILFARRAKQYPKIVFFAPLSAVAIWKSARFCERHEKECGTMKKLGMKILRFLKLDGLLLGLIEKIRLGLTKKIDKGLAPLEDFLS